MFASSSSSPLLVFPILIICSAAFAFVGATARTTLLPESEVKALQQIGKSLGKTDWNFSADPCGGEWGWISQRNDSFENALNCSWPSSINDTVPHVVSIVLKGQSLPGTLPKELVKLPYLQQIDLTRNYLSGTIPPEWGSLPLVNISLLGNRLTGSIPKEIGSISTLESFVVEFNQLSGVIPRELGNLSSIKRLFLTSNNFTGELPGTFAKLTTLNDFRISDNYFTGSIPNFIQNWANLSRLVIQASGLEGPIPPGISLLEKITDLRISDLNGTEELFPPLSNAKNLKILVLRSCNIIGPLPEYLVDMVELKTLYFLNPQFLYVAPPSPEVAREVMDGVKKVITKLVPDIDTQIRAINQLLLYRDRKETFGTPLAQRAVKQTNPAEWWIHYGLCAPELQRIAIRVLSQTTSASNCERNWSTFSLIYTKTRNRLKYMRLQKLVFVHYNMRLKLRRTMRRSQREIEEGFNPINLNYIFEEDDPLSQLLEERETPLLDGQDNSNWLNEEVGRTTEGGDQPPINTYDDFKFKP
ncbi:probable leucine-rich repeat receptor-like serine/threonine-protein kinase At3g14840 isoform X4 [Malania oleifera]|uniref:probable leucine-rich repeat receptor-like serine/threonine-protein kinase At3g14840 isoform X4 n=1 Tax=Malania oleifera TaxID=397392 RepID=UPI0025ADE321|nr:probable leucine-rich repeat receptor-like serine/threonine-protein kinase At3g14840 isoform X4 [Malania oleifera]